MDPTIYPLDRAFHHRRGLEDRARYDQPDEPAIWSYYDYSELLLTAEPFAGLFVSILLTSPWLRRYINLTERSTTAPPT